MIKRLFFTIETFFWDLRCKYNYWLHGPYGLAKVIEKLPFRFVVKYLRKYGATIGESCRFERGLILHRPIGTPPFKNLIIGNNVYLGHNTIIDLSRKVLIENNVIFASGCQIWTHASTYGSLDLDDLKYSEHTGEVLVKNAAIVYSGVIIKHGITIGERSEIGAGSVVTKDIPAYSFCAGVPAKIIRTILNEKNKKAE